MSDNLPILFLPEALMRRRFTPEGVKTDKRLEEIMPKIKRIESGESTYEEEFPDSRLMTIDDISRELGLDPSKGPKKYKLPKGLHWMRTE